MLYLILSKHICCEELGNITTDLQMGKFHADKNWQALDMNLPIHEHKVTLGTRDLRGNYTVLHEFTTSKTKATLNM